MATKRQCQGVIGNAKDPRHGTRCSRWAVNGSEFCAVHGGSATGIPKPSDLANRCVAHSTRSGERCKKSAIAGGTVCGTHGGSAGHVKRKARELLDRAVEPALHQLRDIMLKPGTSDSDRLRAIQMVLDRSGLGPGIYVEHEVKPWEVTLQTIFKNSSDLAINTEIPPDLAAELEKVSLRQPTYEEVIDAELADYFDDDPEPSNVTRITPAYSAKERATVRGSADPPSPRTR